MFSESVKQEVREELAIIMSDFHPGWFPADGYDYGASGHTRSPSENPCPNSADLG